MILWIDGAYGVGKTTVAEKIGERLNNVEILESDFYYQEMLKENFFLGFGGTIPQTNKNFIKRFRDLIIEKSKVSKNNLIVVMSLTQKECMEELYEYLTDTGQDIFHIILIACEQTIISRIENDFSRDKSFSLSYLHENIQFLESHFPDAIRVDTDNKNSDAVADYIFRLLIAKE